MRIPKGCGITIVHFLTFPVVAFTLLLHAMHAEYKSKDITPATSAAETVTPVSPTMWMALVILSAMWMALVILSAMWMARKLNVDGPGKV